MFAHLGVHLANYPKGFSGQVQRRGARRVQGRMRRHAKTHARNAQALQERLGNAFEMRKAKVRWLVRLRRRRAVRPFLTVVPGRGEYSASQRHGQAPLLQGEVLPWLGQIDPANLKERHTLAIAAIGA